MCGVCLCECIVGRGEGVVGREHGLGGLIWDPTRGGGGVASTYMYYKLLWLMQVIIYPLLWKKWGTRLCPS